MASFDLTLTPPQLEIILRPGVTLTQTYEVTNNSSNILFLSASVEPWQPIGSAGAVSYSASANPNLNFSLANADLRLNQNFRLDPGQKRQLVLKIHSNPNTPLGDSYYTFFISQQNYVSNTPQTIGKIGSHILVSTSTTDSPEKKLEITKFSVSPRLKDILFTKITLQGQIENTTDHYFRPAGKIFISKNNLLIKELTLAPQNILAHSARSLSCLSPHSLVTCTLSPPFWPGFYTASLQVESLNHPATVTFFIFPYFFVFLSAILCLLTYLYLRLITKICHPS
jgi:hypothetical protein